MDPAQRPPACQARKHEKEYIISKEQQWFDNHNNRMNEIMTLANDLKSQFYPLNLASKAHMTEKGASSPTTGLLLLLQFSCTHTLFKNGHIVLNKRWAAPINTNTLTWERFKGFQN